MPFCLSVLLFLTVFLLTLRHFVTFLLSLTASFLQLFFFPESFFLFLCHILHYFFLWPHQRTSFSIPCDEGLSFAVAFNPSPISVVIFLLKFTLPFNLNPELFATVLNLVSSCTFKYSLTVKRYPQRWQFMSSNQSLKSCLYSAWPKNLWKSYLSVNSFSSEYCQRSLRLMVQFAKGGVQPRPRCADTGASLKAMAV